MSENMKTVVDIMSVDNPVFSNFILWSSLLIIKFLAMAMITTYYRIKTKVRELHLFFKHKTCA